MERKRIQALCLTAIAAVSLCGSVHAEEQTIQADQIIKNAKIFTSDEDNPEATALVVKDGKFVYVGDEAGLSDYEGEVTDLEGKFIMPGLIDSHAHVTFPVAFEYADMGKYIEGSSKQEFMEIMKDYISKNPGEKCYRFRLKKQDLHGEDITKEDLDAICPDSELMIQEAEGHSVWVNSRILARHNITDDTPDPIPGLSYYERKDGHLTGFIIEGAAEMPIILDGAMELTDEQIDSELQRWIDFCVEYGIVGVFDGGIPGYPEFHERVYKRLLELDRQGKLPVYIDGSYVFLAQWQAEEGLEELKRFRREYNSEHLKVHTMKALQDGTWKIHTAAMTEPYEDTHTMDASTAFSKEELAELLIKFNEENLDMHLHTVGDLASRTVLDGVELARKELGDDFHTTVTCCHLEVQDDADLDRFAELGVVANYTPWWHSDIIEDFTPVLGDERASKMYRCKSVWDSGALVTWSSDTTDYNFSTWNPYLGMEIGMTRWLNEKSNYDGDGTFSDKPFPPSEEKMSIEEMILGYTINGAIQLGIEDSKGSITVGKDADFLVFDKDLLTAQPEGFSYYKPEDVYFCGKKLN